jgi:hypothetical protein
MSTYDVYTALRGYIESIWDFSAIPIAWENEEFKPPSTDGFGQPWVFIQLDDTDFEQESIGSGAPETELWRETGAVLFAVHVPVNSGTLRADAIIGDIRNMMLGLTLPANIRFQSMPTVGRGRGEDGNWYRIWLRVGWVSD